MRVLRDFAPQFAHWYPPQKYEGEPLPEETPPTVEGLRRVLWHRRFGEDTDLPPGDPLAGRNPPYSIGFSFYFVNGYHSRADDDWSMSGTCSLFGMPGSSNVCLLAPEHHHSRADAEALLTGQIAVWDPEYGIVFCGLPQGDRMDNVYGVGWLTYLPDARGVIPPLPAPAWVVPVPGYGSIVVLSEEPFDYTNPEHEAHAHRVAAALREAGVVLGWPPER